MSRSASTSSHAMNGSNLKGQSSEDEDSTSEHDGIEGDGESESGENSDIGSSFHEGDADDVDDDEYVDGEESDEVSRPQRKAKSYRRRKPSSRKSIQEESGSSESSYSENEDEEENEDEDEDEGGHHGQAKDAKNRRLPPKRKSIEKGSGSSESRHDENEDDDQSDEDFDPSRETSSRKTRKLSHRKPRPNGRLPRKSSNDDSGEDKGLHQSNTRKLRRKKPLNWKPIDKGSRSSESSHDASEEQGESADQVDRDKYLDRSTGSAKHSQRRKQSNWKSRQKGSGPSDSSYDENDDDNELSNVVKNGDLKQQSESEASSQGKPQLISTRRSSRISALRRSTFRQQKLAFHAKEAKSEKGQKDQYFDDQESTDSGPSRKTVRRATQRAKATRQKKIGFQKAAKSDKSSEGTPKQRKQVGKVIQKAPARRRGVLQQQRLGREVKSQHNEKIEEEEQALEDESVKATPKKYPLSSRRRSPRLADQNSEVLMSSSDEESRKDASRRSTPPRTSAANATAKLRQTTFMLESDEDTSSSSVVKKRPARSKQQLSSDEEFLADDSELERSVDEQSLQSDSDQDNLDNIPEDSSIDDPSTAVDIDREQVGTADESSSSDGEVGEVKRANPQSARKIISSKVGTAAKVSMNSENSFSSSESSDSEFKHQMKKAAPKLPSCPSTIDAITLEPLPRKHVCYISPDGQSRQCFALETLRQIALSTSHRHYRKDVVAGECQTFLDPPHFRTAMSDDLIDQIASRFGREALDLYGDFYTRKKAEASDEQDEGNDRELYNIFLPSESLLRDEEAFMQRLRSYLDSQMGSRDVYACPLCYSEMHRRIVKIEARRKNKRDENEDSESDESDSYDEEDEKQTIPIDAYDPMLVLGYLDDDQFEAASAFCFAKVAALKCHLRDDHNVGTSGIQGNDLYMRFRVRAPDGLLQRYLKTVYRLGTLQGDMRRYWYEGNNQNFILLLNQMDRAQIYREVRDGSDVEDARAFFHDAKAFFSSFADKAQKEWERLSSPFSKTKIEDLKEFLVDDSDGDVESSSPLFHNTISREIDEARQEDANDLVNRIQRKYADHDESFDSEASGSGSSKSSNNKRDESQNDSYLDNYYSEVEEDDEWINDIRSRKRGRPRASLEAKGKRKGLGKTLKKQKNGVVKSSTADVEVTPVKRRRAILEGSDEE